MKAIITATLIVALASQIGCEQSASDQPEIYVQETGAAESESVGEGTSFEREVSAWTFLDWSGPPATEVVSRAQPMQVDAGGGLKSGGFKWTFADSIGSWLTRGLLVIASAGIFLTLIGTIGSVLGGTGGLSKLVSGIAQVVTFPIPLLGSIVQRARGNLHGQRFEQVVAGGDTFKSALYADGGLKPQDKDRIWELFKASQRQAQDRLTQDAVQVARS